MGEELAILKTSIDTPLVLNEKQITVLVTTSNGGEVRIEEGDSGIWLLFDGECTDMLPYCRAHCCGLTGTTVYEKDINELITVYGDTSTAKIIDYSAFHEEAVMKRSADGRCVCLDRDTHLCSIYENRPDTCRNFHCTRGASMRGWKLANHVNRQCNP